jgi:hypothetical protein
MLYDLSRERDTLSSRLPHRHLIIPPRFFARGFLSEAGCVYRRALVENEDDYFRDYHITIDHGRYELAPSLLPQLPPSYYVMAVDSDIYQRMFDEVSESMNMPCGLFYFGHHADVEYPSIAIAIVGVAVVFSLMLWATIYVDG